MSFPAPAHRLLRARFLERPNRFLVRCRLGNGRVVEAFLPNPGRLWELLLPEAALYLTSSQRSRTRRTAYTCVAVERDGRPVFLHTHLANRVARRLIEAGRIHGLEGAEVVRSEVPLGASRFDLLLRHCGNNVYTEVKSVTLFGNGVAMFPDAVTERGRKHLLDLLALSRETEGRSLGAARAPATAGDHGAPDGGAPGRSPRGSVRPPALAPERHGRSA